MYNNIHAHRLLSSAFDYLLPEERIAKHPLPQRDASKLLVVRGQQMLETQFKHIAQHIPPQSFLVLNNTKVVRARLRFTKASGASIEIFLVEPVAPTDYALSFGSHGSVRWRCLVGNLKRWKNEPLKFEASSYTLTACKSSHCADGVEVDFSWDNPDLSFAQVVELCGEIPIPPYLNRRSEQRDSTDYQTIYAQPEGSVAAPTAGLHFTPKVFEQLSQIGVQPHYITLHVGAGTFRPMKSELVGAHEMHTEHFFADRGLIASCLEASSLRIAVGTTSLRSLESLYWLGVKAHRQILDQELFVGQWEPYRLEPTSVEQALQALLCLMDARGLDVLAASTQIMITPGYQVRMADALITNFHQPRSTLLVLVASLLGDRWRTAYSYAMEHGFRFLSYGDSSLLFFK
ncbi:MAG: S-adenosylmethionine:tRNA ribosyltransferase-isomerase [Bacteroidales bacterium]|nr:S-adenosylmethionine:tRNA ribosyltransferase-isomerase [Bacteroidales bacterium]